MCDLIGWFGNYRGDTPAAQVHPDGAAGIGLVAAYPLRSCPCLSAAEWRHAQMGQQILEDRRVVGLARRDQHHQGAAGAVDEVVDLAGQPAAGTANSVVKRLDGQILVIRPSPLCGG